MQITKEYKYHILYRTINLINNKFYIGIHSSNKKKDNYLGSGSTLKKAIKKYGRKNFIRETLYITNSRLELEELEELVVDKDLLINKYCYNLTEGGNCGPTMFGEDNPMFGKPKSEETKRKISKALSNENHPNWGKEGPNKGREFSKEWRDNIAKANTGRKHSKESIEKMKDKRKGFKHSEEAKRKLSDAHKGKTLTQEHKDNIAKSVSQSLKGRIISDSHRKSLSEAMRGKCPLGKNPNSKVAQHIETGLFFNSLKEGCQLFGINYAYQRILMSKNKHRNFIYI